MGVVASILRVLLLLLDVGRAQVLATGEPAVTDTGADAKYAIIGTVLGVAISAGLLALKICVIRKQVFDNDASDQKDTARQHMFDGDASDTIVLKKSALRRNHNSSERDAQVIEL
ncbi:transmembrane protein 273 isoform X1 [Loxodonta africana]|uniref:transmembrane protein 273 isoform X2 n=1 Tax=Elephas maximus indicus TaxID=99487 RepID=UPI0021170740|nr:transmembrane protein 273 isoform X2 [Elephas maximus indicus]